MIEEAPSLIVYGDYASLTYSDGTVLEAPMTKSDPDPGSRPAHPDLFEVLNNFRPPDKPKLKQQSVLRAEPEILPPMPKDGLDPVIFEPDDIVQALRIFDASQGMNRILAMKEVMLFALKVAAINLDIRG